MQPSNDYNPIYVNLLVVSTNSILLQLLKPKSSTFYTFYKPEMFDNYLSPLNEP